jgi:hypothetical protein
VQKSNHRPFYLNRLRGADNRLGFLGKLERNLSTEDVAAKIEDLS